MSLFLLIFSSICALWMILQDGRSQHISVWLLVLFAGSSIVYVMQQSDLFFHVPYLWAYGALVGLFMMSALLQYCGWGDAVLIASILLWFPETDFPHYLLFSGGLALGTAWFYRFWKQETQFPMAPALLMTWGLMCWQRIF